MRRNDSSSGEMQDAADNTPAVDSAETPMEVTKSKHVKIPPPNITSNGVRSASVSPQQPFGRQSRPQSANRIQFGGNKGPGAPVRYFILKSTNRENVERSIEQGVWSTQRHNEQKLREAFELSKDVFLIFSVNSSGHFQGYARMVSIGQSQGTRNQWEGATQNLGLNFNIEWQRRYELPFQETESLRNPLNEDKPVKISRDGQELPPDIGEALVQLFEEGAERTGVPRPARVRIGAPNAGRMNGQQGMMGRGGGRNNPGRGRGGPDMMNNGPIMPTPGFMGDMGMAPMNAFMPMGPMGQPHMMMGMDPMAMGSMAGFDGDFRMPNMTSMGMAMGPMGANPMMGMGMGMGGGDMGPAFPMAMPPPRPPPRRPLDEGMNSSRPGPTSRPYSSDRIYDDDRVDDYRDQPGRSGYSRDRHRDDGDRGRSARSSPLGYDSRDRRHRGRDRSLSPHRRGRTSSRRRSRSRSRSRSRDRHRQRPSFLDMDYPDYRRNFQEVQESRSRSSRRSRDGDSDRGGGGTSSGAAFMMNPSMLVNNPMMGMLDENAVVEMYANQYRQMGQAFDPDRCRRWFRSFKEKANAMNMGMGMGMSRMMGMHGMG